MFPDNPLDRALDWVEAKFRKLESKVRILEKQLEQYSPKSKVNKPRDTSKVKHEWIVENSALYTNNSDNIFKLISTKEIGGEVFTVISPKRQAEMIYGPEEGKASLIELNEDALKLIEDNIFEE